MYALASLVGSVYCQGSDVALAFLGRQESDVRLGVPWGSARRFCVAGVGQETPPRGQMYHLASLGTPSLLRGGRATLYIAKFFVWQAWCNAKGTDICPCVLRGFTSFA